MVIIDPVSRYPSSEAVGLSWRHIQAFLFLPSCEIWKIEDIWRSDFLTPTNLNTSLGGQTDAHPDSRQSPLRIGDIGLWSHFLVVY